MDNKTSKNVETLENLSRLLWIAGGLFLLALYVYHLYFSNILFPENSDQHAVWGTFGDFMGGTLNPLFALLSLYAIITTIKIQSEELELTRKAMEESNQAQQEQSDSFKKQNISVKLQTFENTFFKLLEHHNGIIENYQFSELVQRILQNTDFGVTEIFSKEHNKGNIKKYFMTLYQILKFVSDQEENFKGETYFNPKLYTNIIRTTFGDDTLALLAINCTIEGFDEYKKLVEKYELFEHLNIEYIQREGYDWIQNIHCNRDAFTYRIVNILNQYDLKAFGKNTDLKTIIANPPRASLI